VQLRAYIHREALLDAWASLRAPVVAIALVALAWRLGRPLWLLAALLLAVVLDPATAVICTVALVVRVLSKTGGRLVRAWRTLWGASPPVADPPAEAPASPAPVAANPGVMETLRSIIHADVTSFISPPVVQA
jgi:hypothetical protein